MSKSAAAFHTEVCRLIDSIKVIPVFVSLYPTPKPSPRGSFSVRRHLWWNVVAFTSFLPICHRPASCSFTWIADFSHVSVILVISASCQRGSGVASLLFRWGDHTTNLIASSFTSQYDRPKQLFFLKPGFGILQVWIYVYYKFNTHSEVRANI